VCTIRISRVVKFGWLALLLPHCIKCVLYNVAGLRLFGSGLFVFFPWLTNLSSSKTDLVGRHDGLGLVRPQPANWKVPITEQSSVSAEEFLLDTYSYQYAVEILLDTQFCATALLVRSGSVERELFRRNLVVYLGSYHCVGRNHSANNVGSTACRVGSHQS